MGWHVEMAPDAPDVHIIVQDGMVHVLEATAHQVSFPLWGLSKVIEGLRKVEQGNCTCAGTAAGNPAPPAGECPVHSSRAARIKVEKWG